MPNPQSILSAVDDVMCVIYVLNTPYRLSLNIKDDEAFDSGCRTLGERSSRFRSISEIQFLFSSLISYGPFSL